MFGGIDPRNYDDDHLDIRWVIPEGSIVQYHKRGVPWVPKIKRTKMPVWITEIKEYDSVHVTAEYRGFILLLRRDTLRPFRK